MEVKQTCEVLTFISCCGFELEDNSVLDFGPVQGVGASKRIDEANRDSIVRAIAYLGPVFLKEVVEQVAPEVPFPKQFGSVCEVCRSIVKNPGAVEALRQNVNLFKPATNSVTARLDKHAA